MRLDGGSKNGLLLGLGYAETTAVFVLPSRTNKPWTQKQQWHEQREQGNARSSFLSWNYRLWRLIKHIKKIQVYTRY